MYWRGSDVLTPRALRLTTGREKGLSMSHGTGLSVKNPIQTQNSPQLCHGPSRHLLLMKRNAEKKSSCFSISRAACSSIAAAPVRLSREQADGGACGKPLVRTSQMRDPYVLKLNDQNEDAFSCRTVYLTGEVRAVGGFAPPAPGTAPVEGRAPDTRPGLNDQKAHFCAVRQTASLLCPG